MSYRCVLQAQGATPVDAAHPRQEEVLTLHGRLHVARRQGRERQTSPALELRLIAKFLQDALAPLQREWLLQHLPGEIGTACGHGKRQEEVWNLQHRCSYISVSHAAGH